MKIRREKAADQAAIHDILLRSFPGPDEALLVDLLRSQGDAEIMLVAVDGDTPVAFVALSRMKAPFRALGLAPVAVLPDYRERGIAARLIWKALAEAKEAGWEGIFLLGNPDYYSRFGFRTEAAQSFQSPYAGPHFMALALQKDQLPETSGSVEYAPAFAEL